MECPATNRITRLTQDPRNGSLSHRSATNCTMAKYRKTRERHEETAAAELPHECAPLEELGGTVSRDPGQRSAVRLYASSANPLLTLCAEYNTPSRASGEIQSKRDGAFKIVAFATVADIAAS